MLEISITNAIKAFREFVELFDYSEFRSVKVDSQNDVFYRASPQCIHAFLNGFIRKLSLSPDTNIAYFFNNIASAPLANEKSILALGEAILLFREKFYASELTYNVVTRGYSIPFAETLSALKPSADWVLRFHFIIELQLELPELSDLKTDYNRVFKAIQKMGVGVSAWVHRHKPDLDKHFNVLGITQTESKPAEHVRSSLFKRKRDLELDDSRELHSPSFPRTDRSLN